MCGTFSEGTILRKCCLSVRRISSKKIITHTIRPASTFQAKPVTRQVKVTPLPGQLQPGLVLFLDCHPCTPEQQFSALPARHLGNIFLIMPVPPLNSRPIDSEPLEDSILFKCPPQPELWAMAQSAVVHSSDYYSVLVSKIFKCVHMVVGTHGNQMEMHLGPADHSRGGDTVIRRASRALPLCDLSVTLLKALKMPLNTPKWSVLKEFRGLTL